MIVTQISAIIQRTAAAPNPAGTDIMLFAVYNSETLQIIGSGLYDASELSAGVYAPFVVTSIEVPYNVSPFVGVSMSSGGDCEISMGDRADWIPVGITVGGGEMPGTGDVPAISMAFDNADLEAGGADVFSYWTELDAVQGVLLARVIYVSYPDPITGEPVLPAQAISPTPFNGASVLPSLDSLSWSSGGYTSNYRVYFGPTGNMALIAFGQEATSISGLSLAPETAYEWRVDSINDNGVTEGVTWAFTTKPTLLPPIPTAVNISFTKNRLIVAAKDTIFYEDV